MLHDARNLKCVEKHGINLEALQNIRVHGSPNNTPASYLIWDIQYGVDLDS